MSSKEEIKSTSNLNLHLGSEEYPRKLLKLYNTGETLAYGGEDGTISVIENCDTLNEQKVRIAKQLDEQVRAVGCSYDGKRIVVGFEDGSTQVFAYEKLDGFKHHPFIQGTSINGTDIDDEFTPLSQEEGKVIPKIFAGPRFSAVVRDLCFDPRSYHVAFASETSPGFCIVNVTSEETLTPHFLEETAAANHDHSGVRGVSYSPDGDFVATLGLDGRLCLFSTPKSSDPEIDWDLHHRDKDLCIARKDVGEINGADIMDRSCFPVWANSSHILALPGMPNLQLRFREGDELKVNYVIEGESHLDDIAALCFSPDDEFLVSSGRDKKVMVWKISKDEKTASLISTIVEYVKYLPTFMSWHKESLHISFSNGQLFSVFGKENIIAKKLNKNESIDSTQLNTQPPENIHKRIQNPKAVEDEDNYDIFKSDTAALPGSTFIDDEAEDADDQATIIPDIDSDEIEKELDAPSPLHKSVHFEDDAVFDKEDENPYEDPKYQLVTTEPQAPFMPSSTPQESRHVLCWNHLGKISTRTEGETGTGNFIKYVDVAFVDTIKGRRVTFADTSNFIMGSMGETGALFATDVDGDDDDDDDDDLAGLNMSEHTKRMVRKSKRKQGNFAGSSIYFYRYESFGGNKDKDWYMRLPNKERVVGCACGEGWAAVITADRYLRTYSSGGVQGLVTWLNGDPISIVGRGRFLAVVYHDAAPFDESQRLGYILKDVISDRTVATGRVSALSKGATLSWIGFNEEFSFFCMDSKGILSMLVTHGENDWSWAPMLDTNKSKKAKSDSFWPTSIMKANLICINLKGGAEYPDPDRIPSTSLGFSTPLASSIISKCSTLEDVNIRANYAELQRRFISTIKIEEGENEEELENESATLSITLDKVILKSFFIAIEANKVEYALDLVSRLRNDNSYDIALKASDRLNLRKLSDRIVDLRDKRFPMEEEPEELYDFPGQNLSAEFDETNSFSQNSTSKNISPEIDSAKRRIHQLSEPIRSKKLKMITKEENLTKAMNPFAKKKMESPAKLSQSQSQDLKEITPIQSTAALARSSTFSKQSRVDKFVMKNII